MGWNDHVEFIKTKCQSCGGETEWKYWDWIGKQRYVGAPGELVGQDASQPPACPFCGSTEGLVCDENSDDDSWLDEDE